MNIIVEQTSQQVSEEKWDWEIHLKGSDKELNRIEYVSYTIRTAISDPIRDITDRASGFKVKHYGQRPIPIYFAIKVKGYEKEVVNSIVLDFDKGVQKRIRI